MIELKMITNREDLRKITGLPSDNHDEALWDAGFDLDDWDVCFVSDVPLTLTMCDNDGAWEDPNDDAWWLVSRMETYCVGYDHVEYDGKHYYIVHHA